MNTPTTERLREMLASCEEAQHLANLEMHHSNEKWYADLVATIKAELARRDAVADVYVNAGDLQGLTLGHYGSILAYGERITGRAEAPLYSTPPATPDPLRDRCEALVKEWRRNYANEYILEFADDLAAALGDSDGK